ncbi:hypothetical protein L7F22_043456 [Adiantum nelumboides]|nr:hypothetical protein [Adiantum nelumboides]
MEQPANCMGLHAHQVPPHSCNYHGDVDEYDDSLVSLEDVPNLFCLAAPTFDDMHTEEHAISKQPFPCYEYVWDDAAAHASHHCVVIKGNRVVCNCNISGFPAQCGSDKCTGCKQPMPCKYNESALNGLIGQCPYGDSKEDNVLEAVCGLDVKNAENVQAILGSIAGKHASHTRPTPYKAFEKVGEDDDSLDRAKQNINAISHMAEIHCNEDYLCGKLGSEYGVGDDKQAHDHALNCEWGEEVVYEDNVIDSDDASPKDKARRLDGLVASTHKEGVGEQRNDSEAFLLPNSNPDIPICKELLQKVLVSSTKKGDKPEQLAHIIMDLGPISLPSKTLEQHYQYNAPQASIQKSSSFSSVCGKKDSIRIMKAYANASFSTFVKLPQPTLMSLTKSLPRPAYQTPPLRSSASATSEPLKTSPKKPAKPLPAGPLKKNAKKASTLPSGKTPLTSNCRPPLKPASLNVVSTPPMVSVSQAQTSAAFARFMALPLVNAKAREEVRLDLRGQKVKSLDCNLVNLTAKLEFVYLRDNKLSHLAGIEILRRVKVLDLSFNEFKGLGLHPLTSCKALQQLYLAGNQLTSLGSLPQLPNLEFLSVAQNKLKDLTMISQPKLQVLAASKNKISTFKGFPHFPSLEHLRVEENPISDTQHAQVVAILLAGPSLKRFNNLDLTLEEQELACMYPPHTGLCIRDGWEFCSVEKAIVSIMKFLGEQWTDRIPPGYTLEQAFIEQPFEEFPCKCGFIFKHKKDDFENLELKVSYQWFIGGKTPSDFVIIEGANTEIYWPKHSDIGHCLKVTCALAFGNMQYAPTFAVSFPVLPGSGCPKVIRLIIKGDFREGNVISGEVEVAWCGGSASKGIVSWLRHDESSSPRMVPGAEEMEYLLSLDDIGAKLILMYTPLTKEGIKGDPCFATTDLIKAGLPSVSDLRVIGNMVEGKTIRGVGRYFGGREGLSKIEWFQEVGDSG